MKPITTKNKLGDFSCLKFSRLFTGLILISFVCFANFQSVAQETTSVPGIITVCPYGDFDGHHHTPTADWIREKMKSPTQSLLGGEPCSTIEVTYIDFPPEAEAAFQAAVDIWETVLSSPITIRVQANWTDLGSGTLGSAGPSNFYSGFTNAPTTDYYASALADQISGVDQSPGDFDIFSNFNSSFDWYYGTDGNTPFDQIDLITVVLHELGHGLGIISSKHYDEDTGIGEFGYWSFGVPYNYDNYLTQGSLGTSLLDLSGTVLGSAMISNNVYNDSPLAVAAIGGTAPRIYAPTNYAPGSSISHWDEATYPAGNINSLMTPQVAYGEANHNPGDMTIGLLEDMGWTICYSEDVFCPELDLYIGDACNDGNSSTTGDIVTVDCECLGTIDYDCPVLEANFGDPCNDGTPLTMNDVVTASCGCSGAPINDVCEVNSTVLTVNVPENCAGNETIGTTTGANITPGADCESTSPDVFYTFNSGDYQNVIINLNTITASDLVISVLETSCGATAFVQCIIGTSQALNVDVNPETNYYVRIHSLNTTYAGDFKICIEGVAPDFATISGSINGWNNNCFERNVEVILSDLNLGNSYFAAVSLSSEGTFELNDSFIIPGTYDVLITVDGALGKLTENIELNSGANNFIANSVILGDLNNSNTINVSDLSLIGAAFGSVIGDANFNFLADLNCNGVVNVTDISLLGAAFGMEGDFIVLID